MGARSKIGRDIDAQVADRLRLLRIERGLTQQQLADKLGVTYQQEHKYERAINCLTAGKLHVLAKIFNVSEADFFEGVEVGAVPSADDPTRRLRLLIGRSLIKLDRTGLETVQAVMRGLMAKEGQTS